MERETWTRAECDLMVELCRYHAQVLLASRNNFDVDDLLPKRELPRDGVVSAGTVLLDYALTAYEKAAVALLTCGFAIDVEEPFHACKLLISSECFEVDGELELPFSNQSHLGNSFSAVFKMYKQNGRLGHPDTLKRIFTQLQVAGLIKEKYGYIEWSDRALSLAYPRRIAGLPWTEGNFLWSADTFDWYLEEAVRQWV